MKIDDTVIGVLGVRTCRADGFSKADVEMARALASQAAIALENSRLYQEVQRAFDELSQTKDQLVQAQKMDAIGQLAGGIAHDFNNILTVIGGRSQLLLARAAANDRARPDIELIAHASDRATALTGQLLAFSRKQVLEPRALDLNALAGGLAPMLSRLIGEHIELLIAPGARVGQVMADPGQLEQVIMNLVVNARDAMPEGGTVKIETGSMDLPDGAKHAQGQIPPGRYVTLTVHDSGCGHTRGHPHKDLRALLHHQGVGQGHRPGSVDRLRHRPSEQRVHRGGQHAGSRHRLHHLPAPHRMAAEAPDTHRRAPSSRCAGTRRFWWWKTTTRRAP